MRLCVILVFLHFTWSKAYQSFSSSEEEVISMEEPKAMIPVIPRIPINFKGTIRKKAAWALYKQISDPELLPGEHLHVKICSPVTMMLPLGQLLFGTMSNSPTEAEILKAMGLTNGDDIKSTITRLITGLKDMDGMDRSIINSRFYVSKTKTVFKSYIKKTQRVYDASVEMLNFERPDESADVINKWMSAHSQGKITNIVNDRMINANSSLVLINAIDLKGKWKIAFNKEKVEVFYSLGGRATAAPVLNTHHYFNYVQSSELNAQIVELPYTGNEVTMVIVLPYHRQGLPILMNTLRISPTLLNTAIMKMRATLVDVTIPKFKMHSIIDLTKFYDELNLTHILAKSDSDISKIVKGENMYISSAIQYTAFEIDADGTEISTAVSETEYGVKPVTIFYADHPFLFYIKANKDQLLTGFYLSP